MHYSVIAERLVVLCASVPWALSPLLPPPWPRGVVSGAVHYISRVVIVFEFHSSEVTLSQFIAAPKMSILSRQGSCSICTCTTQWTLILLCYCIGAWACSCCVHYNYFFVPFPIWLIDWLTVKTAPAKTGPAADRLPPCKLLRQREIKQNMAACETTIELAVYKLS